MEPARISRRDLITAGAVAGVVALAPRAARAQGPPKPAEPRTVITTPPREWGPNAPPNVYGPDPDILTVDPSFNSLRQGNTPILRLWTGSLWAEGPAWCGQGRYLVWSDIPNNRQLRWLEDDGRVSVFRMPSNNSNGNTFDFQGRQLSCEHLMRRVVRYEHDGSATIIADSYNGKRLNSPNDVVAHPDGSYWFTDPPYGGQFYEGAPDAAVNRRHDFGEVQIELGRTQRRRRRVHVGCRLARGTRTALALLEGHRVLAGQPIRAPHLDRGAIARDRCLRDFRAQAVDLRLERTVVNLK